MQKVDSVSCSRMCIVVWGEGLLEPYGCVLCATGTLTLLQLQRYLAEINSKSVRKNELPESSSH